MTPLGGACHRGSHLIGQSESLSQGVLVGEEVQTLSPGGQAALGTAMLASHRQCQQLTEPLIVEFVRRRFSRNGADGDPRSSTQGGSQTRAHRGPVPVCDAGERTRVVRVKAWGEVPLQLQGGQVMSLEPCASS